MEIVDELCMEGISHVDAELAAGDNIYLESERGFDGIRSKPCVLSVIGIATY